VEKIKRGGIVAVRDPKTKGLYKKHGPLALIGPRT